MPETATISCDCGKQVKIKNYKGNINPYKCNKCRGISHKVDSCVEIYQVADDKGKMKPLSVKRNGYKLFYCKQEHQFVGTKVCKTCKKGSL